MRVLLLMRGSAGCGKSTYIEQHGLKPYTLCADDIRSMCSSPTLQPNGTRVITGANDRVVWDMLFKMLEVRMQNGEFTVIDATNSKTSEMARYKELAASYRYRIYCIDMTDIPIEETKRRNANREQLKRVPDEAIDKFYARFETQQIPSGIKVLKPDELDQIWYRPTDLSQYNKIHVVGDIHGCYTALTDYFETTGGIKEDECYIFVGDYIDRGLENAEVVNFIIEHYMLPNFIFLEGNHERWLWHWANDITAKSKEFEFVTKPQLVKANVSKKKTREAYRRFGQCCYFTYHDKTFIATHGGISNIPENLLMIPTKQMISGVGNYQDADYVDTTFSNLTDSNVYQIHGHRNVSNAPIQSSDRTYNLEGDIEFGGDLRVVQITKDNIATINIKNNVFKDPTEIAQDVVNINNIDTPVYELVDQMRNSKNIYEKQFGRISSFNFTKQAFEKKAWDDLTNKARGLYIDTTEYKVVGRAYDKFFNINERPETQLANLRYKFQFPVTAYVKENGFLGIVGWNPEANDLLIASKSTIDGVFSGYLRDALYSIYGEDKMNKIREYIKTNNVSFVFECCDMINDPHIIEYDKNKVVLLDVVKNQLKYEKIPYNELCELANNIGIEVKEKAYTIETWEDFFSWYHEVTNENYKYNDNYIEGFVIEDSVGYMTKLKLYYYNFWKHMRSVAHSVLKSGNYARTGSLLTPIENRFYGWCKMLYTSLATEDRTNLANKANTNICYLRNKFFEWMAENEHGE